MNMNEIIKVTSTSRAENKENFDTACAYAEAGLPSKDKDIAFGRKIKSVSGCGGTCNIDGSDYKGIFHIIAGE
jgi:hypothetical protein